MALLLCDRLSNFATWSGLFSCQNTLATKMAPPGSENLNPSHKSSDSYTKNDDMENIFGVE